MSAALGRSTGPRGAARLAKTSAVWDTQTKMLKRWFQRVVLSRPWLTFLVMGLAFFAFGAGTYNLVMLFSLNTQLIANYGWQALMDGGARQFVELVVTGYLSMAAYVVFKACEHRLSHGLASAAPTRAEGPGKPTRESPVD